ncbi:MAG: hypothetical protein IPM82_30230 [Saprospiraceae bacterium]|nr:hypothetical protein [Saprospiraceae bacterium]
MPQRRLVAGLLLVATAQHLAAYYLDTKWMDAIAYGYSYLVLDLEPAGLRSKAVQNRIAVPLRPAGVGSLPT